MAKKWVAFQVDQEDHAAHAEEARRLNEKSAGRVTLADVLRRGHSREASRLRSRHRMQDRLKATK